MQLHPRGLVPLVIWLVVVLVSTSILQLATSAKVDYARQTGQPCVACHLSPEGGGALTSQGIAYARGGYQWPIPEGVQAWEPSGLLRTVRLLLGYVHLMAAIAWFGAILYIHVIVRPQRLTTGVPKAEGTFGWIGIGVIASSGIGLTIFRYLETGSVFSGTFGAVFIAKLVQFAAMVILAFVATRVLTRRLRAGGAPPAPDGATDAITAETLPAFNGQEGARAIVAVSGKLYDVSDSRLWREGVHVRQHRAGQDLTEALARAPHGVEVLSRVAEIGALAPAGRAPRRPAPQRTFVAFTYANLVFTFGIMLCVAWWRWGFSPSPAAVPAAPEMAAAGVLSEASADCIACHTSSGLVQAQIAEWERSTHAMAQVGCYECHQAQAGDVDAMDHNGYTISVLVTPQDCAACHADEAGQFASSRHSQAGDILASLDNILGERVEGVAAAVAGCQQCHGAPVEVRADGTLSPASWPNTGMGRMNPDGSLGACSTCHTRHLFSVAVAREPAACGNCHMGPDHPQKEIYEESKHGVAFLANREEMNLDAIPWVLGQDYTAAPTCATCHMSALPELDANHDVGLRIAWTLRPAVSVYLEDWEARREEMTQVCRQCHTPGFYKNFFQQYDDAVALYNVKFAVPATEIMARLREADKLTDLDFDEPIEWTYFYLWHHEGRRARHGAAMMGPDYVQWHGFFEVADRFYNDFVPEAEELLPGVTEPYLEDELHQWREGAAQEP